MASFMNGVLKRASDEAITKSQWAESENGNRTLLQSRTGGVKAYLREWRQCQQQGHWPAQRGGPSVLTRERKKALGYERTNQSVGKES